MRQTTLKTLLHHRRAKVDTGLFSTPTMQRVSRSKSRREGRARSYSGVCTLHSDTRKHRGRTHRVSTGGCVRRSRSGKHRSTSRAGSQSRRVKILGNPGEFLIPGSQSPSSALVPAAHTVMGSPEAAGSCRSGICPAGAARQGCPRVPVSPMPAGHRGPWLWQSCSPAPGSHGKKGELRGLSSLGQVSPAESCPVPLIPWTSVTC